MQKIIIVLLINVFVCFFAAKIIKYITGSLSIKSLNIFNVIFYRDFLLYSLFGASTIYLGFWKSYYNYRYISNEKTQLLVWLTVIYATLSTFIFIFIYNFIAGGAISKRFKKMDESLLITERENNAFCWITVLSILSIIYLTFYFANIGMIPLLSKGMLNTEIVSEIRFKDKFQYTGNKLIRNFLLFVLPYLLSYSSYLYYKSNKKNRWRILFIINFFISIFSLTVRFEKSFLIYYFFGFLIIQQFSEEKASKLYLKALGFIILSLGYFIWISFSDKSILFDTSGGPLGRLFISQIAGLSMHYELFPKLISKLSFKYYPEIIANLNGLSSVRSSRLVMLYVSQNPYAGHMNTIFLGEAYANGGWLGVIISPAIVALSLFIMVYLFLKMKKTPMWLACYTYFTLFVPITGGFLDFIYNPTFIIIFTFGFIFQFLSEKIIFTKPSVEDFK